MRVRGILSAVLTAILLLASCTVEIKIEKSHELMGYSPADSVVNFENVEFKWPEFKGVEEYGIEIIEKGEDPVYIDGLKGNTYKPSENFLVPGREYTWRVYTEKNGQRITLSPRISFRTSSTDPDFDPLNLPPSTPSVLFPLPDSTGIPITVTLEWNATDPEGDELKFYIYLDDDYPPKLRAISRSGKFEIKLKPGKTYYWRIVAKDSKGHYSASPIWRFQTISGENTPPEFSNFYPPNGAISVPQNITFKWEAKDEDGDELMYRLYISKDEREVSRMKKSALVMDWSTMTNFSTSLEGEQEYYWRVIAKDSYGDIVNGPVLKFKTAKEGNKLPVIEWMEPEGSIGLVEEVVLTWEATDPDGGDLKYYVYFDDKDPPRLRYVTRESSVVVKGLEPMKEYYWRLVVKDDEGDITTSEIKRITTEKKDYIAVAGGGEGVFIIDVSDPTNPVMVGHLYTYNAQGVYVSGNYAYVADRYSLVIVDVSDPTNPVMVGHLAVYAHGVYVVGDYAYVAPWSGLLIVDVSDPENPVIAGYLDTAGWAYGVYVSGDYAYVVGGWKGLVIGDVSDPTNPVMVGHLDTAGWAYGVYVSGDYAYVADVSNGLVIVDVSDPENPVQIGHLDTAGYAWGVYVSGGYAYVADGWNGLVIVDVSDPENPVQIGHLDTAGYAWGVYVSGGYAYVADGGNGIVIVDVSDPENPVQIGHLDTDGYALGVYGF